MANVEPNFRQRMNCPRVFPTNASGFVQRTDELWPGDLALCLGRWYLYVDWDLAGVILYWTFYEGTIRAL